MHIKSLTKVLTRALVLLCFVLGTWSCGGASPPAGIPAPVSQLLAVSNPDGSGNVTVSGDPGAVNPGALVTATNVSQSASNLPFEKLFMGVAHAQVSSPYIGTTTANSDGSFQLRLMAMVGDMIEITQTVDGETSGVTVKVVTGNTVALGVPVKGLGVDGTQARAYATGVGNNDGLVFGLNFLESVPPSSPGASFTFPNAGGISALGIGVVINRGVAVFPTEQQLGFFNLDMSGGVQTSPLGAPPIQADVLPFGNLAAIGMQTSFESFQIWDLLVPSPMCNVLVDHPNGSIPQHEKTPYLNIRDNQMATQRFVVTVSQYEDGSWFLNRVDVMACPGQTLLNQIALPAGIEPGGLGVFNFGSKALVSDANSNQLYNIDINQGSISTVGVGNQPMGIAVNEAQDKAYVVNKGDNSLSSINLQDFSVQTQNEVGLMPTQVGLFDEFNQAVVLSSSNDAITVVDLTI